MREGALGVPDGVERGEQRDGSCYGVAEQPLGEAEYCQQAGGGEGAYDESRGEDVQPKDVPQRAQHDVRERGVGVGIVGDQPAVVVEVQCGRDVIAALIPVVGQVEEREVAQRDGGEEEGVEYSPREGGETGELMADGRQGSWPR